MFGGGGEIRTHEAVRLWFSRPAQLTAMRHLLLFYKKIINYISQRLDFIGLGDCSLNRVY